MSMDPNDVDQIVDYYFHPDGIPESVMGRWLFPTMGLIGGYLTALGANWFAHRPLLSGFQKHIIFTAVGFALGEGVHREAKYHHAERDAVLKHYISLHPEDFVPEKRVKYKDVLIPWHPIR